ncbi:hypothetical protein P3342_006953 [Pyrenophora teres f. teres]|nr:hypothetical protein P3342_006953 [Pyrenophora teres f. teres]
MAIKAFAAIDAGDSKLSKWFHKNGYYVSAADLTSLGEGDNRRLFIDRTRLYVPNDARLRRRIFDLCHDHEIAGHKGPPRNAISDVRALLLAWNATIYCNVLQSLCGVNDPVFADLGYHPRSGIHPQENIETDLPRPTRDQIVRADEMMNSNADLVAHLKEQLRWAQQEQSAQANTSRHAVPLYQVGDKVWVSTVNWSTPSGTKKLNHRWAGPYTVTRTIHDGRAYELELPDAMDRWQYKIKWTDYPKAEWYNAEDYLDHYDAFLFHWRHPEKPRPPGLAMPADWQPLPEDRDQSPDDFPSGDDSA